MAWCFRCDHLSFYLVNYLCLCFKANVFGEETFEICTRINYVSNNVFCSEQTKYWIQNSIPPIILRHGDFASLEVLIKQLSIGESLLVIFLGFLFSSHCLNAIMALLGLRGKLYIYDTVFAGVARL